MPRDPVELFVAANDVIDRLGVLWQVFRSYRRIPVRVEIHLDQNLRRTGTMTVQMPDDRSVTATLAFHDAMNQPTTAPGDVTWSVSDETVAAITPAADGQSASVQA